jgi:dTDP-glucose 4,6-dehydratase
MRVLVAGGAGFIGSHLCDRLLANGHTVVAADNFLSGRPENVAHLAQHPSFTLIEVDIAQPLPAVPALDPAQPFDIIYHLASPASPSDFLRIPLQILDVGSNGTRNMLELALRDGARFLLASTSEVYGDPLVHPQPETYWGNVDSIGPRSCYDEAKRFAEALTFAYRRVHQVDTTMVRIFNTYGPRMRIDDGRVLVNFIVQALTGQPLTVHGDGHHTRSYCFVSDLVAGLIAVAERGGSGPYNVGNPVECSVLELAEQVLALTGSSSPIVCVPLPAERAGDPQRRRPDISRITTDVQWAPQVGIGEGMRIMIDAVAAELNATSPAT